MTDEKWLFEKTNSERKRNARGVFNKKGGSRSKRCSLPSDHLTEKQRKELNGVIETVNLKKPMSWEEWEKLSLSMKKQYIEALYTMHHARLKDIALMFERRENNLCRSLEGYSIDIKELSKKSKAYRKNSPSAEWEAFISSSAKEIEREEEDASQPAEEPKSAPAASDAVKLDVPEIVRGKPAETLLKVVSGTLNYIGDPAAIFEKVLLALDPSKQYHVQVRYQVCGKED